jgi:hypothetical protein
MTKLVNPVSLGSGNVLISGTGSSGTYSLTTSATTPIWSQTPGIFNITNGSTGYSNSAVVIKGNAEFEGSVKINGVDLAHTLDAIQKRLNILVPDPKLLHKYQALQQAYDHYKTLEALCFDDSDSGTG